jgi:hypothetical protein
LVKFKTGNQKAKGRKTEIDQKLGNENENENQN